MSTTNKQFPKDGTVIISMMKDLGVTSYEPRVVNQLMEFAIRYVSCVLDDARAFANHSSNRKLIDSEDVKLAIMMQLENVFTSPPPRDLLLEVARTKNSVPLPLVKPHCGIRLPPDRYCFSACNYKLKTNPKGEKLGPGDKKAKFGLGGGQLKGGKGQNAGGTNAVKRPVSSTFARNQAGTLSTNGNKPVMKVVEPSGGDWVVGNSTPIGKTIHMSTQPHEVKIEPHDADTNTNKRKREDEI